MNLRVYSGELINNQVNENNLMKRDFSDGVLNGKIGQMDIVDSGIVRGGIRKCS